MDYLEVESEFNKRYSPVTRNLVRLLSNNSRITVTEISKMLGISRKTVSARVKKIEDTFEITYTLDLNEEKLGLENPHLILVKFLKKPDYARIKEKFEASHIVQFAIRTKGTYDLIIYANAPSLAEYLTWDMRMRAELLSSYKASWRTSDASFRRFGFLPLRNITIDDAEIPKEHKEMLKILNENSRISLYDLSKKLGINYKTTVYNFNKLLEHGYIKRFTILMKRQDKVSLISTFSRFIPTQDYQGVEALVKRFYISDDRSPLINRHLAMFNLVGTYDFFTLGVFDNYEAGYNYDVKAYPKEFKRYEIFDVEYGEVKEVLVGNLPVRSIDPTKSFKTFHI